ncbi:hypothetical protein [Oceanisphaera sp. W20_SRM_FM3]|uniref:hypothetical protein n=1 Tax=Oceanisphaera sp. W20_SRM_FM3 TaxID=3240267 RepID=UPI003F97B16A
MTVTVTENGLLFEKVDQLRKGWFNNIGASAAANEAKAMEKDFGDMQSTSFAGLSACIAEFLVKVHLG